MILLLVEYKDDYGMDREQFIISKDPPHLKKIKKILNMYNFCNQIMTDDDYNDFIIKSGNYVDFEIESVKEIKHIKI